MTESPRCPECNTNNISTWQYVDEGNVYVATKCFECHDTYSEKIDEL